MLKFKDMVRILNEGKPSTSSSTASADTGADGIAAMAADSANAVSPGMAAKPGGKPGGKPGKGIITTARWNAKEEKFEDVPQVPWDVKTKFDTMSNTFGDLVLNPSLIKTAPVLGRMFASQVKTALETQDDIQTGVSLLADSIAGHLGVGFKVEVTRGDQSQAPVTVITIHRDRPPAGTPGGPMGPPAPSPGGGVLKPEPPAPDLPPGGGVLEPEPPPFNIPPPPKPGFPGGRPIRPFPKKPELYPGHPDTPSGPFGPGWAQPRTTVFIIDDETGNLTVKHHGTRDSETYISDPNTPRWTPPRDGGFYRGQHQPIQ